MVKRQLPKTYGAFFFKEVKAIGECGLDNHRDHSSPETQIKVFMNHISLEKETQLPLYIHERDAFDQMYSILKIT
ncbi:MAG: hypothetical protein CM15mP93_07990 [Thiotrichaceae bacterium]|nr:MAG: hypothetical protein CM15mP93_07990 [Thiotrichaceae bacterium]